MSRHLQRYFFIDDRFFVGWDHKCGRGAPWLHPVRRVPDRGPGGRYAHGGSDRRHRRGSLHCWRRSRYLWSLCRGSRSFSEAFQRHWSIPCLCKANFCRMQKDFSRYVIISKSAAEQPDLNDPCLPATMGSPVSDLLKLMVIPLQNRA